MILGRVIGHDRGKEADGTAVGAVVGAAVGTGIAASNRGQDIVLPSGTRLSIRLDAPVRLSIDSRNADVARAAVAAGATLINDVSSTLHAVAAELGVGWIAMHMRGDPRTMQDDPRYDDVVQEVTDELADAARRASADGVDEIWLDPGIGFGKTDEHNWALLANLDRVVALGRPVVVGVSRKGFLGRALAKSDGRDTPVPVDDRREGSIAVATWAMLHGARMIRAHDVRPTVHAARVVAA